MRFSSVSADNQPSRIGDIMLTLPNPRYTGDYDKTPITFVLKALSTFGVGDFYDTVDEITQHQLRINGDTFNTYEERLYMAADLMFDRKEKGLYEHSRTGDWLHTQINKATDVELWHTMSDLHERNMHT